MMLQVITQTAPHTSARTVDDGLPVECYGERLVGDAGRLRQNDQATCRDQDIPEPSEWSTYIQLWEGIVVPFMRRRLRRRS